MTLKEIWNNSIDCADFIQVAKDSGYIVTEIKVFLQDKNINLSDKQIFKMVG
jgi:hypothetical protein